MIDAIKKKWDSMSEEDKEALKEGGKKVGKEIKKASDKENERKAKERNKRMQEHLDSIGKDGLSSDRISSQASKA